MSRALMYTIILPLLAAEVWAQFVAHDQQFGTLFFLLALGVLAVRYLLGPQTDEETCPPNCPKCRESWGEDL